VTEKRDAEWAQAKRLCRLSANDVRMAKQLGLRPRSLIKNIPSPHQRWKAPVREWVRELYRKRQAKTTQPGPKREVPSRYAVSPGYSRDAGNTWAAGDSWDGGDSWDAADSCDDADSWEGGEPWDRPPGRLEAEIEEENARLLRRQQELRLAADYVAAAFAGMDEVQRIVLFGSVASPLRKEVPRLRRFRQAGMPCGTSARTWTSPCG
jgi:hypothetical protein